MDPVLFVFAPFPIDPKLRSLNDQQISQRLTFADGVLNGAHYVTTYGQFDEGILKRAP